MFDAYFWSVVLFFAALAAIMYRNRKSIEFHSYVLAMYRTQYGKRFIERIARKYAAIWKVLSTIGIALAFGMMAFGLYTVALSTQLILSRTITIPAIQFVIPLPQAQPVSGLGFIGVPFWFWILIVPFVLFPHEFAHGIISRVSKVRIKNVGLMQLLIWSGAFVEPDEEQIKKTKLINKLRIFSAGSIANISIVLFFLLLTQYLLWPLSVPNGMMITNVFKGTGADAAGLKPGMTIQKIGGIDARVDYSLFSASYGYLLFRGQNLTKGNVGNFSTAIELAIVLSDYKPNQTVKVLADGTVYNVKLSGRPENASLPYIGVELSSQFGAPESSGFLFEFAFPLIWWLTTLGYLVAVFNLLPIYPLDGGLMMEAVVEKISKRHYKKIVNIITAAVIALMVFGFVGPSILSNFF